MQLQHISSIKTVAKKAAKQFPEVFARTYHTRVLFLPRDAMHERGLCRRAVSPSVRLSVRLSRSCIASKRVIVSSNFFSPSRSHTVQVFFSRWTLWQYSDGDPPLTGVECVDGWAVTFGTTRRDWARPQPVQTHPGCTVPNITAHPSTASVPITVLLYNGPLLCGFNVPVKL